MMIQLRAAICHVDHQELGLRYRQSPYIISERGSNSTQFSCNSMFAKS